MRQTLFYGCLRASELCNLDDQDIDIKTLTLHIHAGKSGPDGIALISNDYANILKKYLEIRPPLEIENRPPLFYTDYGRRCDRLDVIVCLPIIRRRLESKRLEECMSLAGIQRQQYLWLTAATSGLLRNFCDIKIYAQP